MGGQRHTPAALPLGMTQYPLCRRLGGSYSWSEGCAKSHPYQNL